MEEKKKQREFFFVKTDSFSYYFYFHYSFIVFFLLQLLLYLKTANKTAVLTYLEVKLMFLLKNRERLRARDSSFHCICKGRKEDFSFFKHIYKYSHDFFFVYFNGFFKWRRKKQEKKNEFPAHTVSIKAYWKKLDLKIQFFYITLKKILLFGENVGVGEIWSNSYISPDISATVYI